MPLHSNSTNWKLSILSAVAIAIVASIPQLNFWMKRGAQWQGAYATLHGDEFLYSGYLNALIEGRPRRNDPFTGSEVTKPLPETTFSIQVVPSFALSAPARLFRSSASTTMIVLTAVAALLAALSIFWLLLSITNDSGLAAAGVFFVLCLGTCVAEQGFVGLLLNRDLLVLGLPFLRRYQPAAAFFLFFVFAALVWRALITPPPRAIFKQSILPATVFGLLIFSYLYLWSAALAWVICIAALWSLLTPASRHKWGVFVVILVGAALALVPYAYLVSHRAHTLDSQQTMISTHRPDLFRIPEIIGFVVVVLLGVFWKKRRVSLHDPRVVFAASFALLPGIVFNQQVITGRSMQPFHFEDFIVNYVSLISVVILVSIVWTRVPKRVLVWTAALSFLVGVVEMNLPIRAYYEADIVKDEAVPVLKRLNNLTMRNPVDGGPAIVFSSRSEIMLNLPTWAPQGTLLGIGSLDFGTATHLQRRDLFLAYLYFSGADNARLRDLFDGKTDDSFLRYYVRSALFGHERALPTLSFHFQPIQPYEIDAVIEEFERYTQNFSHEQALRYRLSYLITRADNEGDLSRLDRWYRRSNPERVGNYNLYTLTLRDVYEGRVAPAILSSEPRNRIRL
jgi:hypothetical protein